MVIWSDLRSINFNYKLIFELPHSHNNELIQNTLDKNKCNYVLLAQI